MKNEALKKLIKEEIKRILNEEADDAVTSGEFNQKLIDFVRDLRANKAGLSGKELQNLLDLFALVEEFAREYTFTQAIEDRIRKIVDPRGKIQAKINNPEAK